MRSLQLLLFGLFCSFSSQAQIADLSVQAKQDGLKILLESDQLYLAKEPIDLESLARMDVNLDHQDEQDFLVKTLKSNFPVITRKGAKLQVLDVDLARSIDSSYQLEYQGDIKVVKLNEVLSHIWVCNQDFWNVEELNMMASVMSVDQFEISLFEKRSKIHKYIKSRKDLGESEARTLHQWTLYQYNNALLNYSLNRAKTNKGIFASLPKVLFEEIQKIDFNNPEILKSKVGRDLLMNYVAYSEALKSRKMVVNDASSILNLRSRKAEDILEGKVLFYHHTRLIRTFCPLASGDMVRRTQERLINLGGESYAELVKSVCEEKLKENTKKVIAKKEKKEKKSKNGSVEMVVNQPYKLVDLNGKEFNISELKGKVVYIDFWASWCGPCRRQFPYSHKLKEMFTEKELKKIAFLYISIDSNNDAWKKAIKTYKLEGVQTLSPGGWNSSVTKYYKIGSIPRYMLMNKKGEIVSPNAPRPQQMQLIHNQILELIKS